MNDITNLRELALELLAFATNSAQGRKECDPVYIAVTEERDGGSSYSSCADLAHWMLYRLGVRASYVNRFEHRGWQVGANLSRLAFSCPAARAPVAGEQYSPGDILLIWNKPSGTDGHVTIVCKHEGSDLWTSDYGTPGGKWCRYTFVGGKLGARKLQKVIPLEQVLALADASGELAGPEGPAAWWDRVKPSISGRPHLKQGSRGARVLEAQGLLGCTTDGTFGPKTTAAVKKVQTSFGLQTTGVIDTATWSVLLDQVPW